MKKVCFILMLCCLLFNVTPSLAAANIDEYNPTAFTVSYQPEDKAITAFRSYPYRRELIRWQSGMPDLTVLYQQIKKWR